MLSPWSASVCLCVCVCWQDVPQHYCSTFLPSCCRGRGTWSAVMYFQGLSKFLGADKSKAHRFFFLYFIHFNGNIYWRLLNNSSCRSYRGVKDCCTVSFFTVFLTVFTSFISAGRHSISFSSGWVHFTKSHLQANRWLLLHSAHSIYKKVNISVQRENKTVICTVFLKIKLVHSHTKIVTLKWTAMQTLWS